MFHICVFTTPLTLISEETEIIFYAGRIKKKNNKILTCKNVFSITPWASFNLIYYTKEEKDSGGLNKRYFTVTISDMSSKAV